MAILARCLDIATLHEVDVYILEYLAHAATSAVLQSPSSTATARSLETLDAFLIVFRTKYPEDRGSPISQMRLRLLRFATLFCRRSEACSTSLQLSSLKDLRVARRERLKLWSSDPAISAILHSDVFAAFDGTMSAPVALNAACTATSTGANDETEKSEDFHGTPESLTLSDALPLYMALSAAFTQLRGNQITRPWMVLTARFMLSTILEQALVFGVVDRYVIAETFAYGFHVPSNEGDLQIKTDDLIIRNMFWRGPDDDVNNGEIDDWKDIRNGHISVLIPPKGVTLLEHLTTIEATQCPIDSIQVDILEFLNDLLEAQPRPVLLQIEQGRLGAAPVMHFQQFVQRIVKTPRNDKP